MCYAVPLLAAIITSAIWGKARTRQLWWLNLLFWGGAIFGIVDHLWHGELFIISPNLVSDLLLGVVITLTVLAAWLITLILRPNSLSELPTT